MRKTQFAIEEYYHIYNCGADKRDVFINEKDFFRFLEGLKEFNRVELVGSLRDNYQEQKKQKKDKLSLQNPRSLASGISSANTPLVEIITYCLNPNHFHFILKQVEEKGIEKFMHKLGTSYTNYFNRKNNRSGSLFQGRYKAIHIDNDSYLLWLSGYINGNVEIHGIAKAEDYKWSSYDAFLGKRKDKLLGDINIILSRFKTPKEYKNSVDEVIKQSRNRKKMVKGEIGEYLLE